MFWGSLACRGDLCADGEDREWGDRGADGALEPAWFPRDRAHRVGALAGGGGGVEAAARQRLHAHQDAFDFAGAILRDIKHTHDALHLPELHRFINPDEAAASLILRETALTFYLDHGRVHVGDLATTTEDAFSAWVSDRSAGLDAIMLAPTRELVAELNRRARDHRLDHSPASSEVRLADGNQASVGDVIITRANDRRLR